jgi:hypothetical protein
MASSPDPLRCFGRMPSPTRRAGAAWAREKKKGSFFSLLIGDAVQSKGYPYRRRFDTRARGAGLSEVVSVPCEKLDVWIMLLC